MRRHIIYSLAAAGTALLTAVLFFLYPEMADAYRANVFIPVSVWVRRVMLSVRLPLAEILFIAAGVYGIVFFTQLCIGNKLLWFARMLSILSSGLLLYVYLWGALYMCTSAFKAAGFQDSAER